MPTLRPPLHLSHISRYARIRPRYGRVNSALPSRSCSSCFVPSEPRAQAAKSPEPSSTSSKLLNPTTSNPPIPEVDHRTIAQKHELFTTSLYSPGSPLFHPNGAHLFNKLVSFLRAQYPQFGITEVVTPTIYKKSLWEVSGHWENYAEDMFEVRGRGASGQTQNAEAGQDEEFGLKPMNCPGHCLLFASEKRGYRDLPIRYADFSALHRNENSGSLTGLTRVRRFHQDDGHIFCRPSQIMEEIEKTLRFVQMVYSTFGLGPYKLLLSTRPNDHFIGTIEEWDRAEDQLKTALDSSGREWSINEGDGAFYGPKIDIILKDAHGREHQTATIQLDFQLPQRFDLKYYAPAPELEAKGALNPDTSQPLLDKTGPVTPVIIHRAILGSVERFMALLLEHYSDVFPFWLNPRPGIILAMNSEPSVLEYVDELRQIISGGSVPDGKNRLPTPLPLNTQYLPIATDSTSRTLSKKRAEAREQGYAFTMVVGKRELENRTVMLSWNKLPQATESGLRQFLKAKTSADDTATRVEVAPETVRLLLERLLQSYV